MFHFLRHGHFRKREHLGTYTYDYFDVYSTYCLHCNPELKGTETLQTFFEARRQNYTNKEN